MNKCSMMSSRMSWIIHLYIIIILHSVVDLHLICQGPRYGTFFIIHYSYKTIFTKVCCSLYIWVIQNQIALILIFFKIHLIYVAILSLQQKELAHLYQNYSSKKKKNRKEIKEKLHQQLEHQSRETPLNERCL